MRLSQLLESQLFERFINLIGDDERKHHYKDEVYALLQKSYEPLGGIKGSGFSSPDEMVKNIPFWKLVKKNDKIIVVILYKDKNGRKSVALGTDGTDLAKSVVQNIIKQEDNRSYSEKSKAALGMFLKSNNNPEDGLVPINTVNKIIDDPIIPLTDKWPEISDVENDSIKLTLNKYPFLKNYAYFRNINGEWLMKVMSGKPNIPIDK
jgi:hypothetical protein